MNGEEPLTNVIEEGLEHYFSYANTQTHVKGTRLGHTHVLSRVIDQALDAILLAPHETGTTKQVQDWVFKNYKFRIYLWRIDEHCRYKAGDKSFRQPLKNPTLRIAGHGEYAIAEGHKRYMYETRTQKNK
jgi:hypothetical protein